VESRTLASWELAWKNGKAEISGRDVFVIDEAGMVGSRQMARVLSKLHEAGAKAVLMGDAEQLQPIEGGAAFRAIAERTGYRELTGIRRQGALWQREAAHDFAKGDASRALGRPIRSTRGDPVCRDAGQRKRPANPRLGRAARQAIGEEQSRPGPHARRRCGIESTRSHVTEAKRRA
jgi:hypothetical protein